MQFDPDILVASQFFGDSPQRKLLEPQRRLGIAILHDAIECYVDNLCAQTRMARRCCEEAEAWILSKDGRYCFSFERICELLEINPTMLRRGLLALRHRRSSESVAAVATAVAAAVSLDASPDP